MTYVNDIGGYISMRFLKISLRLWGTELDPDKVTEILGITPTEHQMRGDLRTSPDGKKSRTLDLSHWVYTINASKMVDEEIDDLLKLLAYKDLRSIEKIEHAILDVYVGLSDENFIVSSSFELRIDNNIINRIGRMGLDLRVTVI